MDTALPTHFELSDPEILVEIKKNPSITALFSKVVFLSMIRPATLDDDARVSKVKIVFNGVKPDGQKIRRYKQVCGFSSSVEANDPPDSCIPASYLQTLFIGLLGKFITTSHFPINPMGLIQIGQSFEQKRAVKTNEILDLSCQLQGITKTLKGLQTQFLLEIFSDKQVVWQGISTFFTRSKTKPENKAVEKKVVEKKEEPFLDIKERIFVPGDTGRKYAGVSGDYNPHHLYGITAKMIGFKHPIAHGMWSLARVMASMEKNFGSHYPLTADASFKLPIFMLATITLGYAPAKKPGGQNESTEIGPDEIKSDETRIDFELRDEKKGIPHLKGQFACALENN